MHHSIISLLGHVGDGSIKSNEIIAPFLTIVGVEFFLIFQLDNGGNRMLARKRCFQNLGYTAKDSFRLNRTQ